MAVHETPLLFTGIRWFREKNRAALKSALFLKDGPLAIRAQYSKLVSPIYRFLTHALMSGVVVCVAGQEKTGAFVDHLEAIVSAAPDGSLFIPDHNYIRSEVQHRPASGNPCGYDTNYGAKVFVKLSDRNHMALNVPTAPAWPFNPAPIPSDLLGADEIFATLPHLVSSRFEGGLLPIELANAVASLSTYPSVKVLSLFADARISGYSS